MRARSAGRTTRDERGGLRADHLVLRALVAAVVVGVVCGLLGAWWGGRRDEVSSATAVILLNPLQGNPFSPDARGDDLVNLETEAQLVTSDAVLERLDEALPGAPAVSSTQVSVSVPTNTQLLSITVTGPTEDEALRATQELATGYLSFRRSRTEGALDGQRENIDDQIQQQTDERAALLERFDALPQGAQGTTLLTQQILATVTRISDLRSQLGEVGSVSLDPGQVVTPAHPDAGGLLPAGPLVPGAVGALLGAALGALAAMRAGRGRRVRGTADLVGLAAPVWGTVPGDVARRPLAAARLRAAVRAAHPASPLVVLACHDGARGALLVAAPALARSLAAARCRTVMVEVAEPGEHDGGLGGDRGSGLGRDLGGDLGGDLGWDTVAPGLADVLRDEVPVARGLRWSGDLGLVHRGRRQHDLDDLTASSAMATLLTGLVTRRTGDAAPAEAVVLLAGSPTSPRTQALAAHADLVLLEVASGAAALRGVEQSLTDLTAAGAARVGIVLVGPPARTRQGRRRLVELHRRAVRPFGRLAGRAPRPAAVPVLSRTERRWSAGE
ncbi:hypothetical protein ABFT23_21725 [Nocardioides sp. C4-1]|uniref:hypothetical protein n=1 Tax=Nocardioides sp. C4-1 TaxID=3151851 RepID=UPI0032635719